MSGVTSTLSVHIETGKAASELLALKASLQGAAAGVAALGAAVTAHGANIQKTLQDFGKGGFGLTAGLKEEAARLTPVVKTAMDGLANATGPMAKAAGTKIGGALGGGLSSSVKLGLDSVPPMYSEMFSRIQGDVLKGTRVNMASLRGISEPFSQEMKSAIRETTDYQQAMGQAQALNSTRITREASAQVKAIKAEEATMWKAYEADKLHSQKLVHKVAVLETREASAQVKAIKAEEATMWKAYEADKLAAVRFRVQQVKALELSMGRQNLATSIARNTGLGMSPSGSTSQLRDGISAFGPVESAAASGAMSRGATRSIPALNESKEAMKRWSNEARLVHDTARGAAAGLGYLWMTWGNIGAMAAGFGAIRAVSSGLKELVAIEQELAFAAAAGGGTIENLNARIMSMFGNGQVMVHTAGQMAGALKNLTLAGFSTNDAFQMLTHTYKFAAAGELDLAEAAQGVQQTMNSFNLPMSETGRVTDVLAKAAAASAVTIKQMVEAMKTGSVVGGLYGVTIEDFAKSAAMLGKVGIVGSAAGTAIKNFYAELASPKSKEAQEAMKALGLNFFSIEGGVNKLKPLGGIIDELRNKFKGMAAVDQEAFFINTQKIFNERGIKEAAQAIKMTDAEYAKFNTTLEASAGYVDRLFDALSKTTQGTFENLKAQGLASLTIALKQAEPAIKELGIALSNLVTSAGFREFLTSSIALVTTLTRLLTEHGSTVGGLVVAYLGFKVSAGVVHILSGKLVKLISLMVSLKSAATLSGMASFGTSLATARAAAVATGGAVVGLRAAITLLAGPLGIVAGLLTAGITLWALWGDSARDAARKARKAADDQHASATDLVARLRKERKEQTLGQGGSDMAEILDKLKGESLAIKKIYDDNEKNLGKGARLTPRGQAETDKRLAVVKALGAEYGILQQAADTESAAATAAAEATAAAYVPVKLTEAASKTKQSTSPLSTVDYSAEIKLYSAYQSEIDKKEQDALTRSNAIRDAGLSSESAYLAERTAIRAKADAEAKTQLDNYVTAQKAAAATARAEQQKQINEGKSKGLIREAKDGKLSGDEATLNKVTAAANRAGEAIAKADQASADYAVRSVQRADAAAMDALARMKDKYGNPDEAIAEAQEAVAAINVENDAIRNLSETTRDKTTVSIESSIRSVEGLITEAWATAEVTGMTYENITALEDKLGTLRALGVEYEKQKGLQGLMKNDPMLGAKQGLRDYLKEAESAGEITRKIVSRSFKGMEDALTQFAMKGKLDFKSLANSIIEDLIRIAARQAISSAVTGIAGMFGFADGGIMSSSGSVPLQAYSSGGIANSPQVAVYGEGRRPEAYVPLPDGRTIPVTLKGGDGGGGGGDVNTTISINVMTDGNTTVTREGASKMGQQIEAEVMRVIFREKRQGGVLSGAT